jgi:hypothetical protein
MYGDDNVPASLERALVWLSDRSVTLGTMHSTSHAAVSPGYDLG